MALNTVSSDRLSTNVKNTNFTAAEKQDLTDDILPLAGQLGNRNLIINGAMQVAQRGTSSTSSGYRTIDRYTNDFGGIDENPTYEQVDVASGTTPYTLGFRKSAKITNGNQTSGAGAGDYIAIGQRIEAQNVATSGWNYLSSSSNITFSFWVKSSVAQSFKGYFKTYDGSAYIYSFDTGSLSADTWTKVTKTIPGNSNLTINNDNGIGLEMYIWQFIGTDYTDNSVTENAWASYASGTRTKDATSTWYTTNDATFEITGVQLEVGSVATDFEHLSFADDLRKCQRYYYTAWKGSGNGDFVTGSDSQTACEIGSYASSEVYFIVIFPELMRDAPTLKTANVSGGLTIHRAAGNVTIDQGGWTNIIEAGKRAARVYTETGSNRMSGNVSSGEPYALRMTAAGVYMAFDAEL